MSRIVQPSRVVTLQPTSRDRAAGEHLAPETAIVGGDGYMDRIAKYIPSEVVAGYMSLDRLLIPSPEVARAPGALASVDPALAKLMPYLPMGVFVLALIFTPLYIMQVARRSGPGTPWITQAVLSTLAFIVWAYATQGSVFSHNELYSNTIAGALVIVFSLASGLFTPSAVDDTK